MDVDVDPDTSRPRLDGGGAGTFSSVTKASSRHRIECTAATITGGYGTG